MTGPTPDPPILSLRNVSKRFGGTRALDEVEWSVARGEVHCLVGENGSGKSTLIKIVSGVYAPDPGATIAIGGVEHPKLTPHGAKAAGIQVIYQDLSLFPNLTVLENVAIDFELGSMAGLIRKRAMRAAAEAALASLDAKLPLDAKVGDLPVAQRQIAAICRGIAANARLLFMDEPTASLTRREVDMLIAVVRRLKRLGVAVVFVSHRLEEVVEIAERTTVMRDGRFVGTFPAGAIDSRRLAELMTGARIDHQVTARHIGDRPVVLEVLGASRNREFADISFTLRRGEVLGLIGLLGAGRTELALALFGMTRLDRGEVRIDGARVVLATNRSAIAAGIAYVSEDRLSLGLNLRQSIADNVAIAVLDRIRRAGGLLPPRLRDALAQDWIARLAVRAPSVRAAAQTLSGGNQQRIVLAKWLATNPKVLILDSPTVGVDIRNRQGIYEVVRKLADAGAAILLISDEVPEVYYNCDRILHMRDGRLIDEFLPGPIAERAVSEAVFG